MLWLHLVVLANKMGETAFPHPAASWNGAENVYVSKFLSMPN